MNRLGNIEYWPEEAVREVEILREAIDNADASCARYKRLYEQRGKDAADAEDQLQGAVDALRAIAAPTVGDPDEHAVYALQLIAREALDRLGGQ